MVLETSVIICVPSNTEVFEIKYKHIHMYIHALQYTQHLYQNIFIYTYLNDGTTRKSQKMAE
jgi:hypothetical protein